MASWSLVEGWTRVIPYPGCPRFVDLNLQPSDFQKPMLSLVMCYCYCTWFCIFTSYIFSLFSACYFHRWTQNVFCTVPPHCFISHLTYIFVYSLLLEQVKQYTLHWLQIWPSQDSQLYSQFQAAQNNGMFFFGMVFLPCFPKQSHG